MAHWDKYTRAIPRALESVERREFPKWVKIRKFKQNEIYFWMKWNAFRTLSNIDDEALLRKELFSPLTIFIKMFRNRCLTGPYIRFWKYLFRVDNSTTRLIYTDLMFFIITSKNSSTDMISLLLTMKTFY